MAKCKHAQPNFDYTPLCDETVVKLLIQNRNSVMSSIDFGIMDENIILTYIDLDTLLDATKLSSGQRDTIQLVMSGYTVADIVSVRCGKRQLYSVFYRRAIRKICDTCNELWSDFYGGRKASGFCY